MSEVESQPDDEHAERHVDQRIDVVAEARLQHAAMRHRADVGQPVDRDERRRGAEHRQRAASTQRGEHLAGVALQADDDHQEERGPHDAVGQQLEDRRARDRLEVEREESPEAVGREGVDEAESAFASALAAGVGGHPG